MQREPQGSFRPRVIGIGRLVIFAVERDGLVLPEIDELQHPLLKQFAVVFVDFAAVGRRRLGVDRLAQNMRPPGLIAPREPGEILALGHVIHDRHFLGHADQITRRCDITDRPDTGILHMLGPHGIHDPRARRQLIAFGVEMMLDGADTPNAEIIRRFDDIDHLVQHGVVNLGIATDRSFGRTVRFIRGR